MRIGLGLTAALLVVAWGVGSSWSAASESAQAAPAEASPPAQIPQAILIDPNQRSPAPPGTIAILPPGGATDPNGFRRPTGVQATALTAAECLEVGGAVYTDPIGLCASRKYCGREDATGKRYRVCLDVKQ